MSPQFFVRWQGLAGFVFFAASLCMPSGYSWGAALAILLALSALPHWRKQPLPRIAWVLAVSFLIFGIFWSHSFDSFWSWRHNDYWIKYALAALCVLCGSIIPTPVTAVRWGLMLGGITSGLLAIQQFVGFGRAQGFANAIQFGDLAVLLAMANWALAAVGKRPWWERLLLIVAGFFAMLASFLSLSRGGWLLLLVMPLLFSLFVDKTVLRIKICAVLMLAGSLVLAGILQIPILAKRIDTIKSEVQSYSAAPASNSETSVGNRLEQWRLAWKMGKEKPITGWGDQGLIEGKKIYVEKGQALPVVLLYGHAHNDVLDMWARRGAVGLLFLLGIYTVPLYVFYPTAKRRQQIADVDRSLWVALCIVGVSVPVGYFVFGLTQVFFAHNSGHMCYLFIIVFIFSALRSVEQKRA